MALLFGDSFDGYSLAELQLKWTLAGYAASTLSLAAGAGRRSSNSFRATLTGNPVAQFYIGKTLVPADAMCIVGFALKHSVQHSNGAPCWSVWDGGSAQVTLTVGADLRLTAHQGPWNGGVLGTTSAPLTIGVYNYVEVKIFVHPSAGSVQVRVNNIQVLNVAPVNTAPTGAAQWSHVQFGNGSGASVLTAVAAIVDYDDIYVSDGSGAAPWNNLLGDSRLDVRVPTGPGFNTGWTPSAAANWQCVDEVPPNGDTDYVTAPAAGVIDTYAVQDAPVPGAIIYGVLHNMFLRKLDAGVCTVAPVIRHGGTLAATPVISPGTEYSYGLGVHQSNPVTGAQWLEADFNAAEFGFIRAT